MGPGLATISGAIDTIALGDVRAHVGLAGAHKEHLGITVGDGDGADRSDRLIVEDRLPGAAGIQGFPDATVDGSEIEVLRLPGHAGHRQHATATMGAYRSPVQVAEINRGFGEAADQRQAQDDAWESAGVAVLACHESVPVRRER